MFKINLQKKYIALGILLLIVISIFGFYFYSTHKPHRLVVAFLDIGQGDAIYIEAPNGTQMLVDGGRDSRVASALAKVMPFGDRSIDVVIGTHPDADHIGGLNTVLDNYSVDTIIESGGVSKSKTYQSLESKIKDKKIKRIFGRAGMKIVLDTTVGKEVYFDILYPDIPDVSHMETNNGSIVGKLTYGATSVMLTADSPIEKELYLVNKFKGTPMLDVDILKLGHHGSRTSSSLAYLKATSPTLAIISAGLHNSYGHPHQEVLDRLASLGIPYFTTYDNGTIICHSDMVKFVCK